MKDRTYAVIIGSVSPVFFFLVGIYHIGQPIPVHTETVYGGQHAVDVLFCATLLAVPGFIAGRLWERNSD